MEKMKVPSNLLYEKKNTFQNLNVSRLVLQLSLPNQLKQGVKSRMKMWLEQLRQAVLQLHLNDQQLYCELMFPYNTDLTVWFIHDFLNSNQPSLKLGNE